MTALLPTPNNTARLVEAEELGTLAGRSFYRISQQLCHPSLWTDERAKQWRGLLEVYRANPYDELPHSDATEEQHKDYAARWEKAFDMGRHAAESEHRRQNA